MQKRHIAKLVGLAADADGKRQPIEKEEKKGKRRANKKPQGKTVVSYVRTDLRHRLVPFNADEVS